ncbi:hypothetical protein CCAND95_140020 [Capnocytophaga canis]|uniref:Uncharacterized protein n=1 Tax=Capnocytophaga canis TaxID=1848903 RepID=A0A0B7I5F7_9FLAO|nr:hypothetical protein CCAND95_140020 [Capnocytophaga canis]CEN45123.1 hypothetical protein CCAND38_220020 [Capnocytophaga canis]
MEIRQYTWKNNSMSKTLLSKIFSQLIENDLNTREKQDDREKRY